MTSLIDGETPLVATLREIARLAGTEECAQAADLIERQSAYLAAAREELAALRGEVERLREALIEVDRQSYRIATLAENCNEWSVAIGAALLKVRAALSGGRP